MSGWGEVHAADDYFHAKAPDILWNESAWFSLSAPERELNGFVYVNHRPNMNASFTGLVLYDPRGEEVHNCAYYDWAEFQELTPSTEMYDFATPNSLTMQCIEPLNRYRMTYDRNDVQLDVEFAGLTPVVAAPFKPGSDGWGPGHYEQPGRMTGTLRLDGTDYAISCASNRDRSWGVRDYQRRSWIEFPRHDYPWFNDGVGRAMNMYTVPNAPPEKDPVHGVTDRLLSGWLHEDGITSPLARATRTALERRADGVASVVAIEGEDELGRTFAAEGRRISVLKWTGLPSLTVFWALYEWRLDSGETVFGETGEVFPAEFLRRHLKEGSDGQSGSARRSGRSRPALVHRQHR